MSRLTLLLGSAGSGKTHRVLSEVAQADLDGGLRHAAELLLIIVPEQQAVAIERALLQRIIELSNGTIRATARVRVMSLSRLAHVLTQRAGEKEILPGEQGRSLLVWRLLTDIADPGERSAMAGVLSALVAELSLHGTSVELLRRRIAEIDTTSKLQGSGGEHVRLSEKLARLADVYEGYCRECMARGVQYEPLITQIPALLADHCWPELAQAQVWVDGFAGFTPAEEYALKALLGTCRHMTATLLIDARRIENALENDALDWYTPTRETYKRWHALTASLGITPRIVTLPESDTTLPRWPADSPLAEISQNGFQQRDSSLRSAAVRAMVCANERAEVDAAARKIQDLAKDGMRYGEISVVLRQLTPYADLIRTRFKEHGIPFFLDQRPSLSQHPAVELVRCALRLALNCGGEDDIQALLRCGLLRADGISTDERLERVDQLTHYAGHHGLNLGHWLMDAPWRWHLPEVLLGRDDAHDAQAWQEARLAEINRWRKEMLAPLHRIRERLRDMASPTVCAVLAALWDELLTPSVQDELNRWAELAESATSSRADLAAQHRGIILALADLFDDLVRLAGDIVVDDSDMAMDSTTFCQWLESGLATLSQGQPPPRLDHVLVTDIERGRQNTVRATLLLGLADDLWPLACSESSYLADDERAVLNDDAVGDGGRRLVGRGMLDDVARESYFALVAFTRSTEYLYFSRPAADANGAVRPASLYYNLALTALGTAERDVAAGAELIGTPGDLAAHAALRGEITQADTLLAECGDGHRSTRQALNWGSGYHARRTCEQALPPATMAALLGAPEDGRLPLKGSTSRLECFAACPFQHFARYFLRLNPPSQPGVDARDLGLFYHEIFQRTVARLNNEGYPWPGTPQGIWSVASHELDVLTAKTADEQWGERAPFIVARARLLLWHHALALHDHLKETGRSPLHTEFSFGRPDSLWPALVLSGEHVKLSLSGFIDRLDVAADGAPVVVDYKLSSSSIDWARFLAGQQLQLFVYMLAARSNASLDATGLISDAEYQPIEPQWQDDTASFSATNIHDKQSAADADTLLEAALNKAQVIMVVLAERIRAGEIAPLPLRHQSKKGWTACAYCDFHTLCRFDPLSGESYRDAPVGSNTELRQVVEEGVQVIGEVAQ